MFGLILTLVATLMHAYLTWRIGALAWFGTGHRRRMVWLVSLGLWLVYLAGVFLGHDSDDGLPGLLDTLAMNWLGALFIASSVFLCVDLLSGFGLWLRRIILDRLRAGALVLALLMIGIALVQGHRAPVLIRHQVTLPGLPAVLDGKRIVAMSDLHLGAQLGVGWFAARVSQVQALRPDMIVLLGDIFEGHGGPDVALQAQFARLQAPLGVYAVTGNHEFHGNHLAAISMTEQAGVVWLRDRWLEVTPGLALVGVDDLSTRQRHGQPIDLGRELLQGRPNMATILLSHSALQVEQAAGAGVGLMLSGHNHGGQIWPFGYLVRLRYPYLAGRYSIGDMNLIVSRGAGLWGPRMRLWQPGEVIEVTLRAAPP